MLAGNGHEVIFAGLYHAPENILTAAGSRNIDLNGTKSPFSYALFRKLLKLVKDEKPDILQANGSDTLKYAVFVKLLYPKLNIVYRNISMVSAWAKEASFKRKFNQWLFKRVSRVTSVGQQSLEDLVKTYAYPVEKTRLIRRGIPAFNFDRVESRRKIAATFGFAESDAIVAHIGQFSPEKNHPFLVESFEKVIQQISNARLIFIGEGKAFHEVNDLVDKKGLQQNIFFAGHRDKVQEWLAGSDLFIMGSTIEGVPGVILEAGMQSLPSVAVKVGGVGEVVVNGSTGIIIEKHDSNEFSHAIISLLKDENLRNKLGSNARDFVMNHYSLENCLREFEILYNGILQEKK